MCLSKKPALLHGQDGANNVPCNTILVSVQTFSMSGFWAGSITHNHWTIHNYYTRIHTCTYTKFLLIIVFLHVDDAVNTLQLG